LVDDDSSIFGCTLAGSVEDAISKNAFHG